MGNRKLKEMNELHLFAGAGGGILGGMLLGHTTVCAVEIEPYRRQVLLQRQRDGILPRFPIWDDVCTFDGKPWRGLVDVVCGGFPCQDISTAGKGSGLEGSRSGLWREFFRMVREIRPKTVFVENSPALTVRGLGVILGNLASVGYDAEWDVFSAAECGADHLRKRIFILAHTQGEPLLQLSKTLMAPDSVEIRQSRQRKPKQQLPSASSPFGEANSLVNAVREGSVPFVCRRHDGMANGMESVSALGDGQVPAVVKLAWETLSK
jgi:DNA (cytosine-5)-methyltransferase 1